MINLSLNCREGGSVFLSFFFFFFGHAHSVWKYPGQGPNLNHSSNQSHNSDNIGSLTP